MQQVINRSGTLPFFLIAVCVVLNLLLFNPTQGRAGSFFLTEQEALELTLNEAEWNMPPIVTRGIPPGPVISISSPSLIDDKNPTLEGASPLNLMVTFKENSAPVDMKSLEVTAKKGFFSKSLTDRVKPFVHGNSLEASGLKVPEGKFRIEILIADIQGNQTSMEYRLVVKN